MVTVHGLVSVGGICDEKENHIVQFVRTANIYINLPHGSKLKTVRS